MREQEARMEALHRPATITEADDVQRRACRRLPSVGSVVVLVALVLGISPAALAQGSAAEGPRGRSGSIWSRAASPASSASGPSVDPDEVHVRVSELAAEAVLSGPLDSALGGGAAFAALDGARQLLERVGARTTHDVRLRFDLGHVLSRLRRYDDALAVLQAAVAFAPDDVRVPDALFEIAVCHATLRHRTEEELTYRRLLEVEDRPFGRAVIHSNLSESLMAQGKLDEAIESAEASLDLDPRNVLARWTLAVIRDRHGDPFGAVGEAKLAIMLDPEFEQLDGPGVFFEPPYDVHWYHALGELAHAEADADPSNPTAGRRRLLRALIHYETWREQAERDDRFLPAAVQRIADLRSRLKLR